MMCCPQSTVTVIHSRITEHAHTETVILCYPFYHTVLYQETTRFVAAEQSRRLTEHVNSVKNRRFSLVLCGAICATTTEASAPHFSRLEPRLKGLLPTTEEYLCFDQGNQSVFRKQTRFGTLRTK
mmetsp:Transcript_10546/g.19750  ORF Transcript_10546/g.19750 Transcript_10546/m.19750 type:complete len:125 (-) Transcript_10546:82-456(-)